MRMLKIFLAIFVLVVTAEGQDMKASFDTVAGRITIAQQELRSTRPDLLSPLSFDILYGHNVDLLLQTLGHHSDLGSWMLAGKTDLLSPWRLELKVEEKYSPLRSVLGSVQLAGTGYLAYQYIKKHGFR